MHANADADRLSLPGPAWPAPAAKADARIPTNYNPCGGVRLYYTLTVENLLVSFAIEVYFGSSFPTTHQCR